MPGQMFGSRRYKQELCERVVIDLVEDRDWTLQEIVVRSQAMMSDEGEEPDLRDDDIITALDQIGYDGDEEALQLIHDIAEKRLRLST